MIKRGHCGGGHSKALRTELNLISKPAQVSHTAKDSYHVAESLMSTIPTLVGYCMNPSATTPIVRFTGFQRLPDGLTPTEPLGSSASSLDAATRVPWLAGCLLS